MKSLTRHEAQDLLNLSLIDDNIASFETNIGHTVVYLKDGRRIEISSNHYDGEMFFDLIEA